MPPRPGWRADHIEDLPRSVPAREGAVDEVGPVRVADEDQGVPQAQLSADVVLDAGRGGCGQGHARGLGKRPGPRRGGGIRGGNRGPSGRRSALRPRRPGRAGGAMSSTRSPARSRSGLTYRSSVSPRSAGGRPPPVVRPPGWNGGRRPRGRPRGRPPPGRP